MKIRYTYDKKLENAFVDEYIANGYKSTPAYKKVFAKECEGISNNAIKARASRMRILMKDRIIERRQEIYDSLNIDVMRVMTELADIGFAEKGDEIYTTKDKLKALELIGKSLGMFEKKEDKDGNVKEIRITIEDE